MLRHSSVETEREFVQVVVKMLRANRALVGAQKPSFHQRGDAVDAGHQFVRPATALFDVADLVCVPLFFQAVVSGPAVRVDHRTLNDCLLDETKKACRRDVGNSPKPNTSDPIAVLFSRYDHNGLLLGLSATRALLGAAHIGFVDLDAALETIPPRAHHGGTKLMKPQPRGLVAAEPEDSLQSESTCSRLLAGGQPHRLEPESQRFVRLFEQRARRDRGFVTTTHADHRQPGPPPCLAPATLIIGHANPWANEATSGTQCTPPRRRSAHQTQPNCRGSP